MRRILLINDDQDTLDLMVTALSSYGYEVMSQYANADLKDLPEVFLPDLVIIDFSEDEVQGEKTYLFLKHHEIYRNVPVIIMSDNPDIILSLDYSWEDVFILKPFDLHFLLQQINCCFSTSEIYT